MDSSKPFAPHPSLKLLILVPVILSISMAAMSTFNRHPDEIHHFEAAKYYLTHFFPPEIGDPSVRDSYSVFGVSYLNYHWAEYFLAGKFAYLVSFFTGDLVFAARLFSVFLLALLAGFFLYRSKNDNGEFTIACFLMITPQLWYVFSYVNNDAFAFFVSILAAYQSAYPQSMLHRFLDDDTSSKTIAGGVWFGLLAGLLLIVKPNYWTFLLFIALWLLAAFGARARLIKKLAFISLIALAVLTFRVSLDFYSNGETNFVGFSYLNKVVGNIESQGRLLEYQEQIAEYAFRPSTLENDLANSHPHLRMRDKGVSLLALFTEHKWHVSSLKSFIGVYGYMDVWAAGTYYHAFLALYLAFFIYLIFSIVRSRDRKSIVQLAIVLLCGFLSVFVSVMLSWIYAYQPQGRYLFPVVGMLGVLVYSNRRHLNNLVVHVFMVVSFLFSVYSFVFWGLKNLAVH